MRLVADENLPRVAVEALRVAGHDVAWIRTDAPGSADLDVVAFAAREQRVLVTMDKDFGEIAARAAPAKGAGVILIRLAAQTPATMAARIADAIGSRDDWASHFSVVEPGRVRMRALPLS